MTEEHALPCADVPAGAGAGNGACSKDARTSLYVGPTLPDNPTGIRDVGISSDKLRCEDTPDTALTHCSANPSTGGTR
ncbi:MAG: hypothetical protein LC779_13280 [Actinobacteria bacterium]|nr:hypothetical protein [Actinomycetota bacterium]